MLQTQRYIKKNNTYYPGYFPNRYDVSEGYDSNPVPPDFTDEQYAFYAVNNKSLNVIYRTTETENNNNLNYSTRGNKHYVTIKPKINNFPQH